MLVEITFEAGCRGVLVYIASEVSVQSRRRLACMTMCVGVRLCQCCSHLHMLEKGIISSDSGMEDRPGGCHGSIGFI